MQKRHTDRKLYFDEQSYTTEKYVIPFIEKWSGMAVDGQSGLLRVLEIGCGEGGNLKPFLDRGCECTGVDLNGPQIERAREFFAGHPHENRLTLLHADIYDVQPEVHQYDIIMLRDVIEHIHCQERLMQILPRFLKPHGVMFFAFPPWMMPFGGHQQICRSRLSKIPYIHLLPYNWYSGLMHACGETDKCVDDLLEIKETGITIERWERILRAENLPVLKRELYFINPNYEVKFGLRPRRAFPILRSVPYLRDFCITAAYYLLGNRNG